MEHLAQRIHLTGVKVVRVAARTRESIDGEDSFLSLHNQIKHYKGDSKLLKLQMLKDNQGELAEEDEDIYKMLYRKAEDLFLDEADVICCTCAGAGDRRVTGNGPYSAILIDEATQVLYFLFSLLDQLLFRQNMNIYSL